MALSLKRRIRFFLAAFLGISAFSGPGFAITAIATPIAKSQGASSTQTTGKSNYSFVPTNNFNAQNSEDSILNIVWPENVINFSQLQNIFSQFPGISQLNIQFPNKSTFSNVTPQGLQSLMGTYQQEAQSLGVTGKLPDLSFSSLAQTALQSRVGGQLPLNFNGNMKEQMDSVLQGLNSQNFGLLNALPDWLRNIIMSVYNAVYSAFEFLGAQLAGIVAQTHR